MSKVSSRLYKWDRVCRKIIEYGILGLVVLTPLLAASVYEWSILIIELTVLVMMAAYFLMRRRPQNNELLSHSLRWPRYLFFGFFVFIFVQIFPFPHFIIKIFSPSTYSFQELFSPDFSRAKFMSISLLPSSTLGECLELLSYFLLGFLIVKTVKRRRQIMRIFYALVAMGVFQAFYGFFELYNKNPRILFYKKIYGLDSVTGTFVNRNHLSGYLEMVIPLTIGLIIARINFFSLVGLKWREKVLRLSEKGFYTNMLLSFGIVIMALAIIFSKSRSGVFLLVFTFILFFEFTVLYFGRLRHQQKWIKSYLKVIFLIITFISLYMGISATIERFGLDRLLHEGRPAVWANVTGIVSDFPLFGTGLGTFASLYPAYEESLTRNYFSHAHNDYIEYLSELGAVGLILLLGGICFMLVHSFLMWRERRHPEAKGLALGGMVAIICILIHSVGDFNLHIPANMLLFTVVLSMTMVTAFYKRNETNRIRETSNVKHKTDEARETSEVRREEDEAHKMLEVRSEAGLDQKSKLISVRSEETQNAERKTPNSKRINAKKRNLLICVLVVIGVVDILVYFNQHLYYRAEKIEETEKRLKVLEAANSIFPSNDLVLYEMGKAYFDLGIRNLDEDNGLSDNYLRKSIQNFNRSLRLNPASRFSHFNYAQVLLYTSYLAPYSQSGDQVLHVSPYDEYKKAALLAGHNSQIFYEAGKIFLSQWPKLSDEDRDFALKILQKIAEEKERTRLQTLMHVWEMNVKDYKVMERILPEDAGVFQMYAEFLGEKSLSCKERQRFLAEAEFQEFERAKSEYNSGENAFVYFQVGDAFQHYKSCLDILRDLKFYQNLTGQKLIDLSEFDELNKQACLKLAKCRLEEGRELSEVMGYLRGYLELEDGVAVFGELESYLMVRGIIGEKLGANLEDLGHLSFQILLYFKQNRYRDIMRVGRLLQESFVVVPEAMKKDYVEVLQLVGDSYQKVDYLYDASDFYKMAREVDSENLGTLIRIRRNHERLSENEKIRMVNEKIEKLLSPRRITLKNSPINKGENFSQTLILDGSKVTLDLHFKGIGEEVAPLISVFFNGRVVWENYLKKEVLSLPLGTKVGENTLVIKPLNKSIDLISIGVSP